MDAGEGVENMNHSHVPGTDGNGAATLGSQSGNFFKKNKTKQKLNM